MTVTRECIERYIKRTPEPSVPEVLGQFLLDPTDEENHTIITTTIEETNTQRTAIDPETSVVAELHYTLFADAETFDALLARHGLTFAGETSHLPAHPFLWGKNPGEDTQLILATGCHPLTGDLDTGIGRTQREEGYASYVYIAGPVYAAVPLYRDVYETASYIKGEFRPLSTTEPEEADRTTVLAAEDVTTGATATRPPGGEGSAENGGDTDGA